MRNTLPKAWRLHDRVRGQINDDGTIQFFFSQEHNMLSVIDRGPWFFKNWMVVMDPWYRRRSQNFLSTISFWIQVYNIPNEYRNPLVIEEIGRGLGQLEGLKIVEPTRESPAEVWIRHENQENLEAEDQIRVNEYIQDVTQPLLNHGNLSVQHFDPIPTPPVSVFEIGSSSYQHRGTKRKADDIELEEFSPSYRQRTTEEDRDGVVVARRPPIDP
ncbi:uncharacterized protein LOC106399025 [Brassica napus]|uniref:uncharacterized protein LOC106314356 n=1 Tax=Brassica oleracea var. oleracea TaxID=109376 RepID=UPI0006A71F3E|nr:PREDICTED: uncharacterized protein LOC106314356 [Brassica oleracea var. oleracea]XP_013694963.1 uncharacterized protein LOC106399025 [Brassica napus]